MPDKSNTTGCFGNCLDPNYEQLIADFKRKYEVLLDYTENVLPDSVKLSTPWKIHCMVVHLPQFLRHYKVAMGVFAEQTTEACHHDFKKTDRRFHVGEGHADHGIRLRRSVVEYNSRRL